MLHTVVIFAHDQRGTAIPVFQSNMAFSGSVASASYSLPPDSAEFLLGGIRRDEVEQSLSRAIKP